MQQLSLFERKVIDKLPDRFVDLESFMLEDVEFKVCANRNIFEELITEKYRPLELSCKSRTVTGIRRS